LGKEEGIGKKEEVRRKEEGEEVEGEGLLLPQL
jgi:hypothetical protein